MSQHYSENKRSVQQPVIEVQGGRLYQRQFNGNYYFESSQEAGRQRRSTGTNVLSAALLQAERYVLHGLPSHRVEIQPGLRELHKLLDDECREGVIDPKTAKSYKEKLYLLEEFLGGENPPVVHLVDIKQRHIEAFIKWRSQKPTGRNGRDGALNLRLPSARTLLNDLDHLRAVFKRAQKRGWIDAEPTAQVKRDRKASKPQVRFLRRSEVNALFEQARAISAVKHGYRSSPCFAPLLEIVLSCGLRRSEAFMLCKNDIDWDTNSLWIRQKTISVQCLLQCNKKRWHILQMALQKNKKPANMRLPKGVTIEELQKATWIEEFDIMEIPRVIAWNTKAHNADRQIPIPPNKRALLKDIQQRTLYHWYGNHPEVTARMELEYPDSRFMFPDADGGPSRMKINYLLAKAAKNADMKCPRLHDLRHTYATWLRQSGIELATIQRLLGHEDMKSTLMYADFTLDEGHRAVENLF